MYIAAERKENHVAFVDGIDGRVYARCAGEDMEVVLKPGQAFYDSYTQNAYIPCGTSFRIFHMVFDRGVYVLNHAHDYYEPQE